MRHVAALPQQLYSRYLLIAFMVSHISGLEQSRASVVRTLTWAVITKSQSYLTATLDISIGMSFGVTGRSRIAAAIITGVVFLRARQHPMIATQASRVGSKAGQRTRSTGAVWR